MFHFHIVKKHVKCLLSVISSTDESAQSPATLTSKPSTSQEQVHVTSSNRPLISTCADNSMLLLQPQVICLRIFLIYRFTYFCYMSAPSCISFIYLPKSIFYLDYFFFRKYTFHLPN